MACSPPGVRSTTSSASLAVAPDLVLVAELASDKVVDRNSGKIGSSNAGEISPLCIISVGIQMTQPITPSSLINVISASKI